MQLKLRLSNDMAWHLRETPLNETQVLEPVGEQAEAPAANGNGPPSEPQESGPSAASPQSHQRVPLPWLLTVTIRDSWQLRWWIKGHAPEVEVAE